MRGADIVPPPTPRGRSIEPRDDAPVTAKDSRELLNRSRSPRKDAFGDMSQDEQEELCAALLQLYALQQIAEKQARGKASRAVKKADERVAWTM